MIPHLRGRPCSLVRTPDGIDGVELVRGQGMRINPPGTAANGKARRRVGLIGALPAGHHLKPAA